MYYRKYTNHEHRAQKIFPKFTHTRNKLNWVKEICIFSSSEAPLLPLVAMEVLLSSLYGKRLLFICWECRADCHASGQPLANH